MPIPTQFHGRLKVPAVASPMFLTSGPDLVVEVCRSGLVGTFPALNARTTEQFSDWIAEIRARLSDVPDAAPFGVNLIVHRSNPRLEADLAVCIAQKVPLVITSLGAVRDLVTAVHGHDGLVFHDVISRRHAEKAAEAGVDGIVAVAAGAGGHAGAVSPFALVSEIRQVFAGTILLGGAINTGAQVLAARVAGADLAYMGTRFIATREAMAAAGHKDMIVATRAADILYTSAISGVNANFLRPSIAAAGLDPDNLKAHGGLDMASEAKAWKNIWSAGQGVGGIADVPGAAELCARLAQEYREAAARVAADPFV